MRAFTILLLCMLPAIGAFAATSPLSESQFQRLNVVMRSLEGIETKSMEQAVAELKKSGNVELHLTIREAMAKTFTELVSSQDVQGTRKKKWFYSMVSLNMAFLQFAGKGNYPTDPLNQLIRSTLKKHLPTDIWDRPGFHQSID